MKSEIHPNYRPVVFMDTGADFSFLSKSTIETSETVEWEDGNTYPLAKVEISSASHPFYTGTMKIVDTAGRVERFQRRYGGRRKGATEAPEAAEETSEAQVPQASEAPAAEAVPETAEVPAAEAAPEITEASETADAAEATEE